MSLFLLSIWAKIRNYVIIAGAVIVAVATAYANGRGRGGRAAEDKAEADKARANLRAHENAREAVRDRHEIEDEISRQPAGDAVDRLHNDGWTRD